jgi:polyisoprenoid-binding protein YceI
MGGCDICMVLLNLDNPLKAHIMRNKLFVSLFSLVFLAANSALSADKIYSLVAQSDGATGIKFSIPYRAGIHHGLSSALKGQVVTDENDQLASAQFQVPIGSLSTNNSTRDCHMREALGIDYTNSRFPKEHVCDSNNVIPSEGPDSIVFPMINLSFVRFEKAPLTPFPVGETLETIVLAEIEIHGQKKEIRVPLKVLKSIPASGRSQLQIKGKFLIELSDFGIIVKPFKLGRIEIGVGPTATVEVDLTALN